ncbi:protein DENND6B-like [Sycon ciliatum]|uniref:protein DENND6B-like n=1 Tax=Sycon ciliatum TaxID=27933 RepID=UPI0031F7225E
MASSSSSSISRSSNWISAICVVTFDLELGQALETIYPKDFPLSDAERMNTCYLAFPDSNSGCMGDTLLHFRVRCSGAGAGGADDTGSLAARHEAVLSPPALMCDNSAYFGFCFFRQVRDPQNKRGYFQKSVIILTHYPFIALFYLVAEMVAPEFFDNGEAALEAVYHQIQQWPFPMPGQYLHLPLIGQVLQVRIPSVKDKPATVRAPVTIPPMSVRPVILPSVYELEFYRVLQPLLPHLYLLWELVLLNEPLAVMAPNPTLCSKFVQVLINMILPLHYGSDYRPYFTIHDTEFKDYTTRTQAPPNVILGVTNPFFTKALQHWPHVVRIDDAADPSKPLKKSATSSPGHVMDVKPGLYTRYKPFITPDRSSLRAVGRTPTTARRSGDARDTHIRRMLSEVTQSFMIPLERYIATLLPLQRTITPWRQPPGLKAFNQTDFLKSLEISGPHLTTGLKGNWTGLYKRFFSTPNFQYWLRLRQLEATNKIRVLYLEAICKADVLFWMRGKTEVEVVDFVLRLHDLLYGQESEVMSPLSPRLEQALSGQVRLITSALQPDMRALLSTLSSPMQAVMQDAPPTSQAPGTTHATE